jgi:amidase
MYDIAGERTGGGSPEWLTAQRRAQKHANAVQRLLDAGATILGKTICDEFFYSVARTNAHYGTPTNVRAPGRLPGGSSAGSAAATAAGVCDLALGSDTGGSIRIPASQCGTYGLRPTLGRIDLPGVMAKAPSFDVPGWFAASPGVFRKVGIVLLDERRVDSPITPYLLPTMRSSRRIRRWRPRSIPFWPMPRLLYRHLTLSGRPRSVAGSVSHCAGLRDLGHVWGIHYAPTA